MKTIIRHRTKVVVLIAFLTSFFFPTSGAFALKQLSIELITWNVIGLDSNNVNVGPNHFPIGARVCNTGDEMVENVKSSFVFDSSDPYIALRPGTSSAYNDDGIDLNPGECVDFYYEVEVTRNANAYEHTREFHITALADDTATVSTPQPRELFVEYLISQSRNSVSDVRLDGSSIPAGGTMTLVVGETYEIQLVGSTATNGYEQIESFINFPNTIFQIQNVTTTYSADTSAFVDNPDDQLYGDGCLWENDPDNPNYRSCLDVGKVGGNITVTFDVKILSVPSNPLSNPQGLSTLIYDFSGSSYHYNSDYSVSTRYANIVNATITKAFSPKTIYPGDTSTLTFEITNPGSSPIANVHFDDTLPAGLEIASSTVDFTGCGSPSPTSLTVGQTDLSFTDITVAGLSVCTIDVSVTGATDGVYNNISDNLFIGANDTGSSASDILVISSKPPAPASCAVPVTMAAWDLSNYSASTSTNSGPFAASFQAADVTTATATVGTGSGTTSGIANTSTYPSAWGSNLAPSTTGNSGNSWGINGGWLTSNPVAPASASTPYFQFQVDASQYGGVSLLSSYNLQGNWSDSGNWYVLYSTDGLSWSVLSIGVWDKSDSWKINSISAVSSDTGNPVVFFRVYAAGAQYTGNPPSTNGTLYVDSVTISGCQTPELPTLSKAFGDASIPKGTTTTLTFSLANPNSSALTGVGFSDELPSGLSIGSPNGLSQSCSTGSLTGGTITANAGSSTFTLSGATMSANADCTISIDVLGDLAGEYVNISDTVSSTETGPNTSSSGYGVDTITVVAPPVISKSFGSTHILTGNTTSLSFSIANPNRNVDLSGVAFTDVIPAGLAVSDGTFSVCGGTNNLTTTAATGTIELTGTFLAANDSCDFSLTVTGTSSGSYTNTTSSVSSTNGGTGNTASASLEVRDPLVSISMRKQVSDSSSGPWTSFLNVLAGSNVYFHFVVENIGDVPLNSVDVTDPAAYVDPSTCVWTDGDGDSLAAPFTLPVASAANDDHIAVCTIGPVTTSSTVGSYANTATASGTYNTTTVTDDSTATYANPEVTLVKTATPEYYLAAADVISYSYEVTNSGGVPLLGPVTIDDDKAADESCPSVTTVGDLDLYLDPGETITCSASYSIAAGDVIAGSVTNTASATVDSTTSGTDDETVYLAALTIDKDTTTALVDLNGTVTYQIAIINTGQYDLTNFQLADTLPFNGGEYSISSVSASVSSGTITPNSSYNGSSDTNLLAGKDTLAAGATATVTLNIQLNGAAAGTYDNTAVAITDQTGTIDDDGSAANDPGTPGSGADPETDEDVTVNAGGTITIIKDANPDAAQDFAFTGSGPAGYDFGGGFSLDDDTDGTLPNTQSFTGLTPGSYSLTEGSASGWSLTGLTCSDPDSGSSVDVGTATASIDLDSGETVTCTYTNTLLGTIVIVKNAVPDDAQDFSFSGWGPSGYNFGGGFSLDDDADGTLPNSQTFTDLIPGLYEVTETLLPGWDLTALTCVDPDSGSRGVPGLPTASIDLDAGETVTCNFTNAQVVHAYTITKTVTDVDGGGPTGVVDEAGDVVTYQVVVENTGNQTITGVSLADPLPASVGSPTESISSNGQLDVGETWTWTYTYAATQSDIDTDGGGDGDIDNTATVSSNEVGDQSSSATVPIVQSPALVMNKEVSDDNSTWVENITVLVNDTVYYLVRVANTGNTTLTGLSVSDPDCSPVRGTDITGDDDNVFEPGEEWAYYCSLSASVGSHTNTATANSNETSPESDTAEYLGVAPPQIAKAFSPGTINAGQISTLTFTITNPNTATALTGVQFDDTFPTSPGAMTVASPANTSTDCGGTVTAVVGTGSMSFSGGSIPADGTCTVEVDVTTAVQGAYLNTSGNVLAANGGTGNQASATLNVGAPLVIDPAITKTGNPASAQVGDSVTFTLVVTNNGNADAIDVVVTDPLPNFLDHIGTTAPGSSLIDYDLPSNTVTIYFDTVQPTDTFTITITTVVNSLGSPPGGTNTATVSSLTTDAEPANNEDSADIEIIVVSDLPSPDTGFAPNLITSLPQRPEGFSYFKLGELSITIPVINLETSIVGVPREEDGWDVTWLWNQIGYLDGSAFPGWNGNSVLTGHVYLPNGMPGPFVNLDRLTWGDQVIVDVYGTRYTYQVRETLLYLPDDNRIIRHEETPWLTLVTCQGFDAGTGEYRWRRVVRAVLISAQEIR